MHIEFEGKEEKKYEKFINLWKEKNREDFLRGQEELSAHGWKKNLSINALTCYYYCYCY
jgi:hypothetical protein